MNAPKCTATDYINFLVATPHSYSCIEASKVQPESARQPAHDAFTRLLLRLEPEPEALWQESKLLVERKCGLLIVDDSTLDKPYATKMELVTHHWSGKHRRTVRGINLLTTLWTDGERQIPCDYRIYDKVHDGLSKNDHFQAMMQRAHERGFQPEYVLFDSWYASLDNLKFIRALEWHWFTQLKANRLVNLDRQGMMQLSQTAIAATGTIVFLKGYGLIKVFKIVAPDGDIEYWATSDLALGELDRLRLSEHTFIIENYHRGIKQFCGIERSQARLARTQRNHIGLGLRAFLRIEHYAFRQGCSWFDAKVNIVRSAVTAYLVHPLYLLPGSTA